MLAMRGTSWVFMNLVVDGCSRGLQDGRFPFVLAVHLPSVIMPFRDAFPLVQLRASVLRCSFVACTTPLHKTRGSGVFSPRNELREGAGDVRLVFLGLATRARSRPRRRDTPARAITDEKPQAKDDLLWPQCPVLFLVLLLAFGTRTAGSA